LGAFSCFPQALKLFNVFLRGDDGKLDNGIGHLVGYVDVASASHLTFSRLEMLNVLGLLLGCSGWLPGMRALHCNPKLIGTLKLTLLSSRRLLFLFVFRNRNPTVFMQPLPASGSGSISACRWLLTPPFLAVPMLALEYLMDHTFHKRLLLRVIL